MDLTASSSSSARCARSSFFSAAARASSRCCGAGTLLSRPRRSEPRAAHLAKRVALGANAVLSRHSIRGGASVPPRSVRGAVSGGLKRGSANETHLSCSSTAAFSRRRESAARECAEICAWQAAEETGVASMPRNGNGSAAARASLPSSWICRVSASACCRSASCCSWRTFSCAFARTSAPSPRRLPALRSLPPPAPPCARWPDGTAPPPRLAAARCGGFPHQPWAARSSRLRVPPRTRVRRPASPPIPRAASAHGAP
jgi:hypothetical protein